MEVFWFEADPSAMQLSELTIDSETTLAPRQSIYLGKLVDPHLATELSFEYFRSSTETHAYWGD